MSNELLRAPAKLVQLKATLRFNMLRIHSRLEKGLSMYLVTGANGKLAHSTIEALLDRTGAENIAVATRNTSSPYCLELAAKGVSVRVADFNDPETLRPVFAGIEKALIIPSPDEDHLRFKQNLTPIGAAKAAGVQHLAYCSFAKASATSLMDHSRVAHYPTELALKETGLSYTIVRNAIYAQALLWSLDTENHVLRRPEPDMELTYVAQDDCGFANAVVLTTPGHEGQTYTLTMSQSYSAADVARLMSAASGQSVRLELIPEAVWPAEMADIIASMKAGELTGVSADFERVTGRAPKTLEQFLREHWNNAIRTVDG